MHSGGDAGTYGTTKTAPSTYEPTILCARTSMGSSVSSIRSKVSTTLDSIHEEDPSIEDDHNDDDGTEGSRWYKSFDSFSTEASLYCIFRSFRTIRKMVTRVARRQCR